MGIGRTIKRKMTPPVWAMFIIVAILLNSASIALDASGGITGYGGVVAEIVDVQGTGDIGDGPGEAERIVSDGGQSASWDRSPYVTNWLGATTNEVGVRMEIQGRVNFKPVYEARNDIIISTQLDNGWWVNERVTSRIVKAYFVFNIYTFGPGTAFAAEDTVFTVQLQENPLNFYESANATRAYIIEIYTIEVNHNPGFIELQPATEGKFFKPTPVRTVEVPQWLLDAGYQSIMGNYVITTFDVTVASAKHLSGWTGVEQKEASFRIGVDLQVFGWWSQLGPNRETKTGPTWWELFLVNLGDMVGLAGGGMIVIAIVVGVVVLVFYWSKYRYVASNKKQSVSFNVVGK